MTDIQNDTIEPEQSQEKRRVGRPSKHENGWKDFEKNSKYHTAYYHAKNKETVCPKCGKKTTLRTLNQHQKSMKCKFIILNSESQIKN
jgi:hypothetical protein